MADSLPRTDADLDEIRNVCRCGTYPRIREAIKAGGEHVSQGGGGAGPARIGSAGKTRPGGGSPMADVEVKSFDQPDETRPFEGKGQAQVVNVAGRVIGRGTFEPGWKWSENVKPIAGTDSCEVSHLGYVLSGRMRVQMDDGGSAEVGPGDVCAIPPGHDAEVVGDEPCVFVDFGEFGEYAKRS